MAISSSSTRAVALVMALSLSAPGLFAQTAVKLPKNRYTPQQDVQLGREAAAEVRKQYPVIDDSQIAAGTTIPVVHPVELVDWATGGPQPAALRQTVLTAATARTAEAAL